MKYLRVALIAAGALLVAACSAPLNPASWTDAQRAVIAATIDQVSEAQATAILTELDLIRHVTVATEAELAVVEDTLLGRFESCGLTGTPCRRRWARRTTGPVARERSRLRAFCRE